MLKRISHLFSATIQKCMQDNTSQMAAALSYYALFSIPPILVFSLFFLSIFLSSHTAQETVVKEAGMILGTGARAPIREVISQITAPSRDGLVAQLMGGIALFIAATGILGHIQKSLNTIWHLSPQRKSIHLAIERRIFGIVFIVFAGSALIVSVITHAAVSSFAPRVAFATGFEFEAIGFLNDIISFLLTIAVISLTFRFIPSGRMAWRDILIGSTITAILYTCGRVALAVYLTHTAIGSAYGAAGSIILLLFWIYYSSLIFFFGAAFTYIFSKTHGSGVQNTNP